MSESPSPADRIEKSVLIRAPRSRVWRALTDHRAFSAWFNIAMEGPFAAGATTFGEVVKADSGRLRIGFEVVEIRPESRFAYRWHPYPLDPAVDYSREEPTLVEFTLAESAEGTLLRVVESGFDKVPAARRAEAFRMNTRGWEIQLGNVTRHVENAPHAPLA